MSFGKIIAQKRKNMLLTQEELAKLMNVSKSAIGKWETDGGIPDRDNLYKLAEILHMSIDDLHQMIAGNEYSNELNQLNITSDIISILDAYGYKVVRKDDS